MLLQLKQKNSLNKKDQHKSRLKKNAYCKPKCGWNITNLTLLQYTDLHSSTCTQGHREPLSLVSLPSSNHFTGEKDTWRVTALHCLDNQLLLVFLHREKSLSHQHHYCFLFAYLASLKGLDWSARGSNLTGAYFTKKLYQFLPSPLIFLPHEETLWPDLPYTGLLFLKRQYLLFAVSNTKCVHVLILPISLMSLSIVSLRCLSFYWLNNWPVHGREH